jgi:hypothetical protein
MMPLQQSEAINVTLDCNHVFLFLSSLNTYGIVVESSVQHCAIVLLIVLLLFLFFVILIVLLFPRPQQQSCCCIVCCDFNCLYPIQG